MAGVGGQVAGLLAPLGSRIGLRVLPAQANPPTDGASQAGYATDVAKDLDRSLLLKAVEATTCG